MTDRPAYQAFGTPPDVAVLPGFPAKRRDAIYPASPRGSMALRAMLGPCKCTRCGMLVWWAHSITRDGWNGPEILGFLKWRERGGRVHKCAA